VGVSGAGANAARPHLHFEIYGSNPHILWHDGQGRVTCFESARAYSPAQTRLTYPVPCGPA
jgi:murein DD-endopeptidase MepM/ murein hydrolase activator NlpD